MVDIETLGQGPGCVIVSLAAVEFSTNYGIDTTNVFNQSISVESCTSKGMHIDDGTKEWWDKQEASYDEDGEDLSTVLGAFNKWLSSKKSGKLEVWANSPSFDCVILKKAYEKCNMSAPWGYWNQSDVRTTKKNFLEVTNQDEFEVDFDGIKHDPLNDVKRQALEVLIAKRTFQRT